MEADLCCNFKRCRKRLSTFAWVTSCSHIFCDEDGTREFNEAFTCPACQTSLSGKLDIIRIDLQPTEQYKSMVLSGLKPETIMEICTRSMAFWTYQSHQERAYQEYVAKKSKDRISQLEQCYETLAKKSSAEIQALKLQISSVRKELDSKNTQYNTASEKFMEKSRQYQKLQALYDALRRKSINPSDFENQTQINMNSNDTRSERSFNIAMIGSGGDAFTRQTNRRYSIMSPPEMDFVLQPRSTPLISRQRSSVDDMQRQFAIDNLLSTPSVDRRRNS
ncbi:unnamed protein product [Owenia fusiformis]|uniref:Uncharacterized protein n=1 Tax=Owenia fusiformis TaxID=6347 RepID=A0A8J1XZD8_OWEFU|nr:unnamed protein product [Owenia fusiformis]